MYKTLDLSTDIKLIISDFDGIFTDGGVYIGDNNNQAFKRLSFKDLMGVSCAIKSGFKIAFVSGEKTPAIDIVCSKFNIEDNYQGIRLKKEVVEKLLQKYSLSANEVLYIGDDINDIDAMRLVKYRIAPQNANWKVKETEGIQITQGYGGDGAFREVVDNLIELKSN